MKSIEKAIHIKDIQDKKVKRGKRLFARWRRRNNNKEDKMKRAVLFVFNSDPMCFIHVLLNALDMSEKGHEAGIVVEGSATKLLSELAKEDNPLHTLWVKARENGVVYGVCRTCSQKMGTHEEAQAQGLALLDDMAGHPGMAEYQNKGFEIITF